MQVLEDGQYKHRSRVTMLLLCAQIGLTMFYRPCRFSKKSLLIGQANSRVLRTDEHSVFGISLA